MRTTPFGLCCFSYPYGVDLPCQLILSRSRKQALGGNKRSAKKVHNLRYPSSKGKCPGSSMHCTRGGSSKPRRISRYASVELKLSVPSEGNSPWGVHCLGSSLYHCLFIHMWTKGSEKPSLRISHGVLMQKNIANPLYFYSFKVLMRKIERGGVITMALKILFFNYGEKGMHRKCKNLLSFL